ncbi:MAG: HlyD family efflux transporter periplasmic adaptor subunit [Burkholderiales bacterium]|nr:HlyD family efflux transporter periplasmic adaptor subunit [Burkholderiales bacterium]
MQASVLTHARCAPAATAFATELATAYGCRRVSVGFTRKGFVRLVAVSHGHPDNLAAEAFDPVSAAMDEAVEQGVSIHLPIDEHAVPAIRAAHARLLPAQGGAVASIPMLYQGEIVGGITAEWATGSAHLEQQVGQLENLVNLIGPVLYLMYLREVPWRERVVSALQVGWRRLCSPEGRRTRLLAGAAITLLVALLFVPIEHRVGGRARIEGAVQRSLVAPMDGFLKTAGVRPGDRVQEGQVLVELADDELRLQRRKWASELAQHENAYAAALARFDRAAIVNALSRVEEARAHLDLIDADLTRLQVAAPFDGTVIQGDLGQMLGAPIERGRVMLVLMPGERHRVVVEVDERDIAQVAVGQSGVLSLSALPWDTLPIRVSRITPIARAVDGNNIFEVETEVDAGADRIRPGLEGVAKLTVGRRSLAYGAYRAVAERFARVVWIWMP